MPVPETLPEQIATRLRGMLSEFADKRLPPIAALAPRFKVSRMTMWKAVRILADQGLLYCRRGEGITLTGGPDGRGTAGESVRRLHDSVRDSISDGTFHCGDALPKIGFFVSKHHCSATTVIGALRSLCREGLIHRKGQRWIVGTPALLRRTDSGRSGEEPSVLLITVNEEYWRSFFSNSFTVPFTVALCGELRAHRIGLSLATVYTPRKTMAVFPAGLEETKNFIRSLGRRYQGALVVFFPNSGLKTWLAALDEFQKPVLTVNLTNEPLDFTARPFRQFCCLHLDEEAAVTLAMRHLYDRGHRRIGIPVPASTHFAWAGRRVACIREVAARLFPDMCLTAIEQREVWWEKVGAESSPQDFLQAAGLPAAGPEVLPLSPDLRKQLARLTNSLEILVYRESVNAVLALNNELARKYYLWFRLMGIDIPRQLSLLSFDDTPEAVTFPISTVDFGFSRLGYLAAHILIGDIPVKTDRRGAIAGTCELIDRGSVGYAQ